MAHSDISVFARTQVCIMFLTVILCCLASVAMLTRECVKYS